MSFCIFWGGVGYLCQAWSSCSCQYCKDMSKEDILVFMFSFLIIVVCCCRLAPMQLGQRDVYPSLITYLRFTCSMKFIGNAFLSYNIVLPSFLPSHASK